MIFNRPAPVNFERRIKKISQNVSGDLLTIEAQSFLKIMGFPIGNSGPNHNGVDGQLGEKTLAALQAFQILTKQEPAETLNTTILINMEKAAASGSTFRSIAEEAGQQRIHPPISPQPNPGQFVNTVYYYAILDEMLSKVPAASTTAQAILKTGYGQTIPTDINGNRFSYNLFGLKGTGPAGSIICWTQEPDFETGIWQPVQARFRAYHNFGESIKEHNQFFLDNMKRYSPAFKTSTPADFAKAITKAGYAADSSYAKKLIQIMSYWGLS